MIPSTPPIVRGPIPNPAQIPPTGAVGGANVRIGAVIDIEHRSLRAFEQDKPARLDRIVEQLRHVGHQGPQPRPDRHQLRVHRLPVQGWSP